MTLILLLIGLILGVIIGLFSPISIPAEYARYTAVAILALIDSIIGAIRSDIQKNYYTSVFLSGLVFNMLFCAGIVWFGDKLALDLYLAVIIVLMIRIMQNVAIIRRFYILKLFKKIPEKDRRESIFDRRYDGSY